MPNQIDCPLIELLVEALVHHQGRRLVAQTNQVEVGPPYLRAGLAASPVQGQYWLTYVGGNSGG